MKRVMIFKIELWSLLQRIESIIHDNPESGIRDVRVSDRARFDSLLCEYSFKDGQSKLHAHSIKVD